MSSLHTRLMVLTRRLKTRPYTGPPPPNPVEVDVLEDEHGELLPGHQAAIDRAEAIAAARLAAWRAAGGHPSGGAWCDVWIIRSPAGPVPVDKYGRPLVRTIGGGPPSEARRRAEAGLPVILVDGVLLD